MAKYTKEEINKLIEDSQSPYSSAIMQDAVTGAGLGALVGSIPLSAALFHSKMTPSNCYGLTTPGAAVTSLGIGGLVTGSAGGLLGGAAGGVTGAIRNLLRRTAANRKLNQLIEEEAQKRRPKEAAVNSRSNKPSYAELADLKRKANKSYLRTIAGDALLGAALGGVSMGVPAGLYSAWLQNDMYTDAFDNVVIERDAEGNPTKRGKCPNAAYPIALDTGTSGIMGAGVGLVGGALYGLIDTIRERRKAKEQLASYESKKKTAGYSPYNLSPYLVNGATGTLTGVLCGMLYNKITGKQLLDKKGLLTGMAAGTLGGLAVGHRHKQRINNIEHGKDLYYNKYTYLDEHGNRVMRPGQYMFYTEMAPGVTRGTVADGLFCHGDNVSINEKDTPFSIKYKDATGKDSKIDAYKGDNGVYSIGFTRAGDPADIDKCYINTLDPSDLIKNYLNAYADESGGRKFRKGKNPGLHMRVYKLHDGGKYDVNDSPAAQFATATFNRIAPFLAKNKNEMSEGDTWTPPKRWLPSYSVVPNARSREANCIGDALAATHGLPGVDYTDFNEGPLGAPTKNQLLHYYRDISQPSENVPKNLFSKAQLWMYPFAHYLGMF